jgi:hypothetical protein
MADDKRYILIIRGGSRSIAYGLFEGRVHVEHAAMDYYGTAVTGASARDAFLIVELQGPEAVRSQ